METQEQKTFTCAKCGTTNDIRSSGGTGYARNDKDEKICYQCCADTDREWMKEKGKITLYLTTDKADSFSFFSPLNRYKVSNWPGTLSFPCYGAKASRHNFGYKSNRIDFWFSGPDGFEWHGYQIGNWNQIAHCRRTKRKTK